MDSMKSGGRPCGRVRQHRGMRCALTGMIVALGTAQACAQCAEQQKLTASDAGVDDQFGFSVYVSGDAAVVGTSGEAYIFRFNGTSWVEEQELAVSDPGLATFFGETVSISGGRAVVGAWADVCAAGLLLRVRHTCSRVSRPRRS